MKNQRVSNNHLFELAINLTEEILSSLQQNNIARIDGLYSRRQQVLEDLFTTNRKVTEEKLINKLLALNEQVVEKLKMKKISVLTQQQKINHGNQATKAYQKHL